MWPPLSLGAGGGGSCWPGVGVGRQRGTGHAHAALVAQPGGGGERLRLRALPTRLPTEPLTYVLRLSALSNICNYTHTHNCWAVQLNQQHMSVQYNTLIFLGKHRVSNKGWANITRGTWGVSTGIGHKSPIVLWYFVHLHHRRTVHRGRGGRGPPSFFKICRRAPIVS